jgi:serine/threonine protein kinase
MTFFGIKKSSCRKSFGSDPSKNHLFTREDKFRGHIATVHQGNNSISLDECRILGIKPHYPGRCGLCTHHRHRNWKDRCQHIVAHYKNGDFDRTNLGGQVIEPDQIADIDDDDNDDDNDDGDDEGGHTGQQDESKDHRMDGPSFGDPPSDQHDKSPDTDNDPGFDFNQWLSPECWNFPTTITLQELPGEVKSENQGPSQHVIRWLGRVNKKGGTAAVYKVAMPLDLDSGDRVASKNYAVKQYPMEHEASYSWELEAFSLLGRERSIIRCYGTFEYFDRQGRIVRNILLEYGECDLREFWADTLHPQTAEEILEHWSSLLQIAEAVMHIHDFRDQGQKRFGRHGDIKPDNILCIGDTVGTLKIADLGFAGFAEHEAPTVPETRFKGGTQAYSMFPTFP